MKKFAAILLMLVFLFNLFGYQYLISFLKYKADIKLESRIDNNEYDEASLTEIRVSLNMPYQQRYTEFERHYGEINIEGKAYTYVKRKIEGDVLVLKCISNESKQRLRETSNDLTKSNSGQDQENNGKKNNSSHKIFSGDYDDKNQFCDLSLNDILKPVLSKKYSSALTDVLVKTPHQPPRFS